MKYFFLTIVFFFTSLSFSQTKLYVHPNASTYSQNTQTIALLPLTVEVKLRPRKMKSLTAEQIVKMEKSESLDIQKGMHSWFLTRKKRGEFSKTIQSPMRTNALLKKAGIDIPEQIEALFSKPIKHKTLINKTDIEKTILSFL